LGQNPLTPKANSIYNHAKNVIADFDGDGKKDELIISFFPKSYPGYNVPCVFQSFKEKNKLLTKVNVTPQHSYSFVYKFLPQNIRYSQSAGLHFKQAYSVNIAIPLVNSMNYYIEGQSNKTISYYYKDLMCHRHGRGLMGFLNMTMVLENPYIEKKSTTINEFQPNALQDYKLDLIRTSNYRTSHESNSIIWEKKIIVPTDLISQTNVNYTQIGTTYKNFGILFQYANKTVERDIVNRISQGFVYSSKVLAIT
jgi:hypothetical protein